MSVRAPRTLTALHLCLVLTVGCGPRSGTSAADDASAAVAAPVDIQCPGWGDWQGQALGYDLGRPPTTNRVSIDAHGDHAGLLATDDTLFTGLVSTEDDGTESTFGFLAFDAHGAEKWSLELAHYTDANANLMSIARAGDTAYIAVTSDDGGLDLTAVSTAAGRVLWTWSGLEGDDESHDICASDSFVWMSGPEIIVLDAALGLEVWRGRGFGGRSSNERDLVQVGDVFVVLDDECLEYAEGGASDEEDCVNSQWTQTAYDLAKGEARWQDTTLPNTRYDSTYEMASSGDLVYVSLDATVVANDASSGDRAWTREMEEGTVINLIATDDVVIAETYATMVALDAASGEVLWSTPVGERGSDSVVVGDLIVHDEHMNDEVLGVTTAYALADGAALWQLASLDLNLLEGAILGPKGLWGFDDGDLFLVR